MIGAILLILHVFVCIALILVVLLQSSKGGGLAGAFGGGGGGTVFGGRETATFLEKATRYLAVSFMVTSLLLAFSRRGGVGEETARSAIQRAAQQSQGRVAPQDQTSIEDFLQSAPPEEEEGAESEPSSEGGALVPPPPEEEPPSGTDESGGGNE
jgi:preprotein translocase subunit SecG